MSSMPEDARLLDFEVEFVDGSPVVSIRGEVDLATGPGLSAMLHALIDQGHSHVLINLAAIDFIDASGIGVLVGGAERLKHLGGSLGVENPSRMIHRILAIVGLSELETGQGSPVNVGLRDLRNTFSTSSAQQTGRIPLRGVVAIPVGDDIVDAALRLVVSLAQATVGAADGVSVSLRRHGHLTTVAASDNTVQDMDADQYATGEGPCVDASNTGRGSYTPSLLQERRWPSFTPQAAALGISAILASPLLAGDRPVGSLNLYSRTPSAFKPEDEKLAAIFAREASLILSESGIDVSDEELAARLQSAMRSRQVIAQAQGFVMHRESISAEDAYSMLRRDAQSDGVQLRQHAEALLAPLEPPEVQNLSQDRGLHR